VFCPILLTQLLADTSHLQSEPQISKDTSRVYSGGRITAEVRPLIAPRTVLHPSSRIARRTVF